MIVTENRTPFPSELLTLLDKNGREVYVVVVVSTFQWEGTPELSLASSQEAVCLADEHRGDPSMSSIVREADISISKPLVDVVVNGFAYAPGGRLTETVTVELQIGDIQKRLQVYGDRLREHSAGKFGAMPRPIPFQRMPVIYERAFGGTQTASGNRFHSNPIGLGFQGAQPTDPAIRTDYPNIEHSATASSSARELPAGFGVVGRGWSPRLASAGTYDDVWLDQQWPLPPKDFDDRHFQCAPKDQQSLTIKGGESVRLTNLTPEGTWEFRLPLVFVPIHLIRDAGRTTMLARLDTIYLRPEMRDVVLCHRLTIQESVQVALPREIVLGHVTGAWLHARRRKRMYWDKTGMNGEIRNAAYFT